MAGAAFDGPDAGRWLARSRHVQGRQLDEQILPSGEHFERSPMYHALVLETILDIRDATAGVRPDLSDRCDQVASRMADLLEGVLHPDGAWPLLGDSCFGEAPPPQHLLERAERGWREHREITPIPEIREIRPLLSSIRSHSGAKAQQIGSYWTFRDGGDYVVLDAGPVGADHLPAHAHSDLLTWEASLGGQRLVVDSGVYHYQNDAMRQYCRSTAAHNVLQIDDRPPRLALLPGNRPDRRFLVGAGVSQRGSPSAGSPRRAVPGLPARRALAVH
jgi:hypothetical protein